MSYQVLALKYRPQNFEEVIGQDHVTTTLKNAIDGDRVAHAVLFTGPRGTGKTTIARILAKAMNCETGPVKIPCNTCNICLDITRGHAADVFEIDGASNNSVDQVRELRENVTYMPASARLKIYIIDEVHMLSTAAFNALLKTLEEPPDHVMFIFATTEVHKIPATILSRCQRHDLGRVRLDLISSHLNTLCRNEGFTLSEESCEAIAIQADGSIRDSLSLLDRILSISPEPTISHDEVLTHLGVINPGILMNITRAIIHADGSSLIDIIDRAKNSGHDLKRFYNDIITHFRNLTILKVCGPESAALEMPMQAKQQSGELILELSAAHLNALVQVLLAEENLVNYAFHTQTALEMVMLKLLTLNPSAQLDSIIQKLDLLAQQIDGQLSPCPYTGGPGAPTPAGTPPTLSRAQAESPSGHHGIPNKPPLSGQQSDRPASRTQDTPPSGVNEPASPYIPASPNDDAQIPVPDSGNIEPAHRPVNTQNWQAFIKSIEKPMPFISALLLKSQVKKVDDSQIIIELSKCSSFDSKRLETKHSELVSHCRDFFNRSLKVSIIDDPKSDSALGQQKRMDAKKKQDALSHPFVAKVTETFNGSIVDIT